MDALQNFHDQMETARRAYHAAEAVRIAKEVESLGPEFADDGIVCTILRERIAEEVRLATECCGCRCCGAAGHWVPKVAAP